MPKSGPRFVGTALRAFPVLAKWGLKPREASLYPIGGGDRPKAPRHAATLQDKRDCVRTGAGTLYHDLGVVAFDGCTYAQTQQMGCVLADLVALGGPAALHARSRGLRRMPESLLLPLRFAPAGKNCHKDARAVVKHLQTAATLHLRDHLRDQVYNSDVQLDLVDVAANSGLLGDASKAIQEEIANGKLFLPVDIFWSMKRDKHSPAAVRANLALYSPGTGTQLGEVTLAYRLDLQDRDHDKSELVGKAERSLDKALAEQALNSASGSEEDLVSRGYDVFLRLWRLEQETWAPRASGS